MCFQNRILTTTTTATARAGHFVARRLFVESCQARATFCEASSFRLFKVDEFGKIYDLSSSWKSKKIQHFFKNELFSWFKLRLNFPTAALKHTTNELWQKDADILAAVCQTSVSKNSFGNQTWRRDLFSFSRDEKRLKSSQVFLTDRHYLSQS